jgi:hypothetical protein
VCVFHGEKRNANTGFRGRKAWTTWVWMGADIKMYLQELGWESVGWSRLANDRDHWRAVVSTLINYRVP